MQKNLKIFADQPMLSVMARLRIDEIRRLRKEKRWTLAEAAERARFSSGQQWSNVETGFRQDIRYDTLYAIAQALGVPMERLIAADNDPPPPPIHHRKRRKKHRGT